MRTVYTTSDRRGECPYCLSSTLVVREGRFVLQDHKSIRMSYSVECTSCGRALERDRVTVPMHNVLERLLADDVSRETGSSLRCRLQG